MHPGERPSTLARSLLEHPVHSRPTVRMGPQRRRRRSPVATVAFQFTEQHGKRGLRRPATGGLGSRRECRRQPTLPHRIGKHGVRQDGTPRLSRRADLGYDTPPLSDENGLATSRQPHVLAEPAVQCLDSDGSHGGNVATCSSLRAWDGWPVPASLPWLVPTSGDPTSLRAADAVPVSRRQAPGPDRPSLQSPPTAPAALHAQPVADAHSP